MIISHDLKLLFIHVHRTGGSTLTNIFTQNLAHNTESLIQHGNAKTFEAVYLDKYSDYFTFGFARNPWDRMLSWYSLLHLNNQKSLSEERKRFEEFLATDVAVKRAKHYFHYNALDYFPTKNGQLAIDKIFLFEKLEDEIKSLCDRFDLGYQEIGVVNETNKKRYQDYYTERSRELIAQKCKRDIEYFDYTF